MFRTFSVLSSLGAGHQEEGFCGPFVHNSL
uniref:Uncharacterized protein n=1 Tax=Arundo donax TaxID=35708 RepID=A0A0A8YV97_ARUDO